MWEAVRDLELYVSRDMGDCNMVLWTAAEPDNMVVLRDVTKEALDRTSFNMYASSSRREKS